MELTGRGAHGGLFSGAFAAFFAERPYLAAAVRAAAAAVGAAVQALGHVAAVALHCPACEALMDWNWGWCPYHADPQSLRDAEVDGILENEEADGVFTKEEFVSYLNGTDRYRGLGIAEHLDSTPPGDKVQRLFVHFTEFRARRRSLADGDG